MQGLRGRIRKFILPANREQKGAIASPQPTEIYKSEKPRGKHSPVLRSDSRGQRFGRRVRQEIARGFDRRQSGGG